jgi:hypothetical protein
MSRKVTLIKYQNCVIGVYNGIITEDSEVYKQLEKGSCKINATFNIYDFEIEEVELWNDTDLIFEVDWCCYNNMPNDQNIYKIEAKKRFEEQQ